MSIIKQKGLRGLPGLNSLSDQERQAFMLANEEKLKGYSNPGQRKKAAEILYNNQQFINTFGQEKFDQYNNGTEQSYDFRNNLLREKVIDDAFKEAYSPFEDKANHKGKRDNTKGMGKDFEYYYGNLSTDAKEKLLRSEWMTPEQLKKYNAEDTWLGKVSDALIEHGGPVSKFLGYTNKMGNEEYKEARNQLRTARNQRILDNIYANDADAAAKTHAQEISQAYLMPAITGKDDTDTKKKFKEAITPSATNLGITEFASRYGNGDKSQMSSEMEEFSIDDMRQILAKKAVYDATMSPQMAATALNNEAKRWLTNKQTSWKKFERWALDTGISAMSYTADKINGLYNLALAGEDFLSDRGIGAEKPVVWVDTRGEVVDSKLVQSFTDAKGEVAYRYKAKDGKLVPVHQEQLSRTTLHNMGKEMDGSDAEEGVFHLNPLYWSRAEQFGTLDSDKQKQYEKLGSSPYKVNYNPNDDSDLTYEAFKMMSFGLADGLSMFIPYGIGTAGKALSTAGKVGKVTRGLGKGLQFAGESLSAQSKFGQVAQGLTGAGGIAYAYQRGSFQETLAKNLADLDEAILQKARQEVPEEEVPDRVAALKDTPEYQVLQQRAIQGAGDVALATFLPEAVKYGFVNTIGFRKWLYSNPASLQKKAGNVFKGLEEVTTEGGKQRLAAKASKFATRKDKLKQFGKVLGGQVWGGAWTNGTDDMMVDAAERINNDSFNQYLNGYINGEGIAETYGFADGLYSYWKGLGNSLGQDTTWNAAAVGGLGSVVSVTPHFANIAHLATKRGRQDFQERYKDGSWRDKANYFMQNGVLNTYYGAKVEEQDMKHHADYVNKILDDYEDFKVIEDLITSDLALQNAEATGDQKTMRFVKAINAVNALEHLGNSKNDPATMSSVVQNMKSLIERAAQMDFNTNSENALTEEETNNLIAQYYANNPSVAQSDYSNQLALYHISENAQELQKASKAYDDAEKKVQKVEYALGRSIDSAVRAKLKMSQALNDHWKGRVEQMQSELDDNSVAGEVSLENLIPSIGGRSNAEHLLKVYGKQLAEIGHEYDQQQEIVKQKKDILKEAQKALAEAKGSDARYVAEQAVDKAQAEYDNVVQQQLYLDELDAMTKEKEAKVKKALAEPVGEEGEKVLTAEEIFALDPVTRARMLNTENRELYSKAQQREIDKLEQRLVMRDGEALEKIQDIALLTQRIQNNEDAYSRMAKNPEAAAVQLEAQRQQEAEAAYKLINHKNAETVADVINQFDEGLVGNQEVSQEQKEQFVFQTLRKLRPSLLETIAEEQMLPQYQKQLEDALDWGKVTSDIDAVIREADRPDEWKINTRQNVDQIIASTMNKTGIMTALEQAVSDTGNEGIEAILDGLEKLGYQRDATIVEERQKRKDREAAEKSAKEVAAKKVQEDAQAEAAKKALEAEEWAKKANQKPGAFEDVNLEEVPLEEEEEKPVDAIQQKEETPVTNEVTEMNLMDNGDTVQAQSASIEEQATIRGEKEQHLSSESANVNAANERGEQVIDTSATTLSGNAMAEYQVEPLKTEGRLVHKQGKEPNDSMSSYYAWMDAAGIKLQNIIDVELADILKNNPEAKVKFMAVRAEDNATHDKAMNTHLMLVLDFDDKINRGITTIHQIENGGVLKSDGKDYLVIGVAGYGRYADKQVLYDILFSKNPNSPNGYGLIRRGQGEFFRTHPDERFYVPDGLSTEVVSQSLIPSYLVKQLEGEEEIQYRPITELLKDPQRNPHGLSMESLAWGIQEKSSFVVVGTTLTHTMVPRNIERNLGSAFVLVPASNGKLIPSYLKPLFYTEMNDGALKDRVNTLLMDAVSPDYATRKAAVDALGGIFHMDKDGDFILLGKDGSRHANEISLAHQGDILKSFVLNSDFDRQQFMEAVEQMNPRVNITMSVLQSPALLQQYNEAGALQTDIARLATAGSSYSIYGVDANGQMLKPEIVENDTPKVSGNSDFRNGDKVQVVYQHQYYQYNANEGRYSLNGQEIHDEALVKALDYNRRIIENGLSPVETNGVWGYFVFGEGSYTDVIKVNKNTYDVRPVTEMEAQHIIDKAFKEKAAKERNAAAEEALEHQKNQVLKAFDKGELPMADVPLEEELIVDTETGELVAKPLITNISEKEKKEGEEVPTQQPSQKSVIGSSGTKPPVKAHTQTFQELTKSKAYRVRVITTIRNKWPEAPTKITELDSFLRDKHVEVDAIGTSEVDVQAWIKTLEDCR